ncbi:hypothetical protein FLBR109950_03430 [Flavobacterium branchiophilum]
MNLNALMFKKIIYCFKKMNIKKLSLLRFIVLKNEH